MEIISFNSKLSAIQAELKAPKSQLNKFGGYAYRKAEDILEAVKPLLVKYGCALTCSDELVHEGERYYIRARAILHDNDSSAEISCFAYAREEAEKKGMDASQVTGASSSYARKYALNGLFCIDDTADSDTTNQGTEKPVESSRPARTKKNAAAPEKPAEAPANAKKGVITDQNVKTVVEWVCKVPEGPERDARVAKAKTSYEWTGNLWDAFVSMVELS